MKLALCLLAMVVLTSFTKVSDDENIDGVWMGYYRTDFTKEKLIVKFNSETKTEFYTGGVDDRTRTEGSYQILGDSVSIKYVTPDGTPMVLRGHFNYRKNFVDGVWLINNKSGGSFFLEKQEVQEFFTQP
jgi:hypothetical protein